MSSLLDKFSSFFFTLNKFKMLRPRMPAAVSDLPLPPFYSFPSCTEKRRIGATTRRTKLNVRSSQAERPTAN